MAAMSEEFIGLDLPPDALPDPPDEPPPAPEDSEETPPIADSAKGLSLWNSSIPGGGVIAGLFSRFMAMAWAAPEWFPPAPAPDAEPAFGMVERPEFPDLPLPPDESPEEAVFPEEPSEDEEPVEEDPSPPAAASDEEDVFADDSSADEPEEESLSFPEEAVGLAPPGEPDPPVTVATVAVDEGIMRLWMTDCTTGDETIV